MDLIAFSIEGYRRFAEKTSLKLHGNLIAVVGPNEAGKSSLLKAMAHLNSDDEFERNEHRRRTDMEPKLSWQFQLGDDKSALEGIHDTAEIEKVIIEKNADGTKHWSFRPRNPQRDKTRRDASVKQIRALSDCPSFTQDVEDEIIDRGVLERVEGLLEDDPDDYTEEELAAVRNLASALDAAAHSERSSDGSDEGDQEHVDEPSPLLAQYLKTVEILTNNLEELAKEESADGPLILARAVLQPRLPRIEEFTLADRELKPTYDLVEDADNPPSALMHLASLGELDLKALREEAVGGATADVSTRRNRSNRKLLDIFDSSWNQQGIAIQFEVQGTTLLIQASSPEDSGLSDIGEHSDGMLWFAALLAFTHNWQGKPILLADEIETHLHYDAQSDLMNVLSKQEFTSKVIYTTHSFGCLPHDLGNGVRAVEQTNATTSRLRNDFWNGGAGFSPLLAAMGATAVSFTPSRRAVVGEGAGEAILLPTLLRQASNTKRLDFQVVPGIAVVAAVGVAKLRTEAGRLAFIVDGDKGGLKNRQKLIDGGVSEHQIVVLWDGLDLSEYELEDFIDPSAYVKAVNAELACWNQMDDELSIADLSSSLVTKGVDTWCKTHGVSSPDKSAVAQRVVNVSYEKPIFAPQHQQRLTQILNDLQSILDSPLLI